MRRSLTISALLLISTALMGQQCSQTSFRLTQDDIAVSGPCDTSLLSGDIVTVKETQGYDLSCATTAGNSAPGTIYFTDHLTLTGNGARFCGTVISAPFNCDPRFSMSATTATSVNDFNRFFFTEVDRTTGGNACSDLATQSLFRQCAGQPCDAPPPPPPCIPPPSDQEFTNNNPGDSGDCEPLILDLTGDGFHLTDTSHGVIFDIRADGHPLRLPWTADSRNGFLALDRNGNGLVDDGSELFGNVTPQPQSVHPNGFGALAQYDWNGDGIIDDRDPVYSLLRIWIDANHDGICQPEEMHTLPELSVVSISLDYSLSGRTDEYGNVFRYKAHVNRGLHGPSDVGKTAYDVLLVTR